MPQQDHEKPIEQLIDEIVSYRAGSEKAARTHAIIDLKTAKLIESALDELRLATNRNAESSDALARRVFWLNVVIAVATVVATIVAVATFFDLNQPPQ